MKSRPTRNPYWSKLDLFALFVMAVYGLIYTFLPTTAFYNPQVVTIKGYEVTVVRSFPLSPPLTPPIVQYNEVVFPLEGTLRCSDSNGWGHRYMNRDESASWDISNWAAPCMDGDYHWRAKWRVMLFGFIPLRATHLETVIIHDEETGYGL